MGKSLSGKKLPKGITQRQNGQYMARFTTVLGARECKTFDDLTDAKDWLKQSREADEQFEYHRDMTVQQWYEIWIETKRGALKFNTIQGYENTYNKVLKPTIAKMHIREVKAFHIQRVFNSLRNKYSDSTMRLYKSGVSTMFKDAVNSELISSNPAGPAIKLPKSTVKRSEHQKVLTVKEQALLEKMFRKSSYGLAYCLVLQTGLRVGEVCGLRWQDVDLDKSIIHIRQQAQASSYRSPARKRGEPIITTPKTESSVRDIPLTKTALQILREQKMKKVPRIIVMEYKDYVFHTLEGNLYTTSTLNKGLKSICAKAGLPSISMHTLRHTFATRCMEAGMKPKVLQEILGHSDISTTLNIYTHVLEDERAKEISKLEDVSPNWCKNGAEGVKQMTEGA